MKLYIDTSVWSFVLLHHDINKRNITEKFLANSKTLHESFISETVIQEVQCIKDNKSRSFLLKYIEKHNPEIIKITDEAAETSKEILKLGILTERSAFDALHLSIAIYSGMDALISWNMKDLVKLKTRRLVSAFCRANGHKELDIVTPEEV